MSATLFFPKKSKHIYAIFPSRIIFAVFQKEQVVNRLLIVVLLNECPIYGHLTGS